MKEVFRLHGMPASIVSDSDTVFIAQFWKELFRLQGIELAMSFAYHPQSDGQIAVVNRSLEHYLRAFVNDKPHTWVTWLHFAEHWININFHTYTEMTPFEALYGYSPPKLLDYVPRTTPVVAVDQLLQQRQHLLPL